MVAYPSANSTDWSDMLLHNVHEEHTLSRVTYHRWNSVSGLPVDQGEEVHHLIDLREKLPVSFLNNR